MKKTASFMPRINPYLIFNGDCEQAFNFYKSVFGGEFGMIARFKDMAFPGMQDAEKEKIMHMSLPMNPETSLMGSDCPSTMDPAIIGNNVQVSLNLDSPEETQKLYQALSEGGKVFMPLAKVPWARLYAMFTDKFGINWQINCD